MKAATCDRLHVGDKVRFTGAGWSVLHHGPGLVKRLGRGTVWVEVLVAGELPNGDHVEAGEEHFFAVEQLEVVR